jgi:nuclear pore complex protein Nup85
MLLDQIPPDPTNLEDMIHASLFSGKPEDALLYASRLDAWLAAHMADIMDAISLLETEADEYVCQTQRPPPKS